MKTCIFRCKQLVFREKFSVNILVKIWIHCRGEVANEVSENVEEADLSAAVFGDASECNHGIQVQLSNGFFFLEDLHFFKWYLGGILYVYFWKYLNILESPIESLGITSSVGLKVLKITFFLKKRGDFQTVRLPPKLVTSMVVSDDDNGWNVKEPTNKLHPKHIAQIQKVSHQKQQFVGNKDPPIP